jgi:hypothetical protein
MSAESRDPKHEFDLHVSHITETHKAFIDNTGKVAGFLLLGLGWFATSESARAYLAAAPYIARLAALAVVAAFGFSAVASWIAYRVTEQALRRLAVLDYLPPSAYAARRLSLPTFVVCVAGNGVLATLLVLALLSGPASP